MSTTTRPDTTTTAPNANGNLNQAISTFLTSKHLPPTQQWLQNFLPTTRPSTPLNALQKTALFRLLSTDLTASLQISSTTTFPSNVSNPELKERKLPGPIPVQILDIEDLGHSRWSQVENLEARERGETTKGREVVRVIPEETTSESSTSAAPSNNGSRTGPHKLLLQDARGTKVYAFEVASIDGIDVAQTAIGAKLVLRDVVVARGLVLLEPGKVVMLGGKVEEWDKKWKNERKETLKLKAKTGVEVT